MRIYQTFNRILIIFLAVTFLLPSCQKLDYWNHNGHQNDKGGDGRIAMDWYRFPIANITGTQFNDEWSVFRLPGE